MKSLLHNWVTDQARQRPDSIAVSRGNTDLTYGQLEVQSNQLANLLDEYGCASGDRVCLLMPKVPEAIVCLIGILKADCVYVPLDLQSSADSLARIVEKCRAECVLAAGNVANLLLEVLERVSCEAMPFVGSVDSEGLFDQQASAEYFWPTFTSKDLNSAPSTSRDYNNISKHPAHIFFDFDPEEEPRGVITSHQNNLAFIRWAKNYFDIQGDDHLSNYPPLHSDMSLLDIYGALSAGAQLHLVPQEEKAAPQKMASFIRENEITQWFTTPPIIKEMAEVIEKGGFPSLKRVIWRGEDLSASDLRYWMEHLPDVRFTRLYGSAETTVGSSYYTAQDIPESDSVELPIGKPCVGEALYVLDDNMNTVSDGEVGDLYVSGPGVSLGYWNDPERTDEAFKFNPHAVEGQRTFYKTGDKARFDEEGLLYLHRPGKDQIHRNGQPVELTQIEEAINSLHRTIECAVVAVSANGNGRQKLCCAYVPLGKENSHIAGAYLELKLANLLPEHMIPELWKSYVILPKNRNGKINRRELENRFRDMETQAGSIT